MSRERAPVMSRMQVKVEAMKKTVTRFNPKKKGEDDDAFTGRVKKQFQQAMFALAKRERRSMGGHNKYRKPHQGAQECARRVRQDAAGHGTCNYTHGCQYPSLMKFGDTL